MGEAVGACLGNELDTIIRDPLMQSNYWFYYWFFIIVFIAGEPSEIHTRSYTNTGQNYPFPEEQEGRVHSCKTLQHI